MTAAHRHDGGHRHAPGRGGPGGGDARRLGMALALVCVYMAVEVAGGLISGSLALLADAGHMLSDAGALSLSLFAMRMGARPPTAERTFGFHRAEILAALANGAALFAIAAFIVVEAIGRLWQPAEVAAPLMIAVAAGGLVVNLVGLRLLAGARHHSLNLQGAWLHIVTDTLGSVQAIAAGLLIWQFGWHWVDPAASIAIAALVVYSSSHLLRQSVAVLMEGAPGHIRVDDVRSALLEVPHVVEVHDLHVWSIASGFVAVAVHLVCPDQVAHDDVRRAAQRVLNDRFGIRHTTIQIDTDADCGRTGSA